MKNLAIATGKSRSLETLVQMGRHRLVCDEPAETGGQDAGPTPFELLAASLAVCTAMTLQMYASRHGVELENLKVEVTVMARGRDDDALTTFERRIYVEKNIEAPLFERLLEIAAKCPVHRALEAEVNIASNIFRQS